MDLCLRDVWRDIEIMDLFSMDVSSNIEIIDFFLRDAWRDIEIMDLCLRDVSSNIEFADLFFRGSCNVFALSPHFFVVWGWVSGFCQALFSVERRIPGAYLLTYKALPFQAFPFSCPVL